VLNLVDSSGWLEYFTNSPNAEFFVPAIEETGTLLVPTIVLYEVFKRTRQGRSEADALPVSAYMSRGRIVDLTRTLAIDAARLSADMGLAMADSVILATAQAHQAAFWTQDKHFNGLPSVHYVEKQR
jgi:predicted nucleic acid-binding protein